MPIFFSKIYNPGGCRMFTSTTIYSNLTGLREIIEMPIDLKRYMISLITIRNTKITKNNRIQ